MMASEMNFDSKGRLLTYDVREDEEQVTKLEEIIQLLVSAGYFRARIKGLSSFDKVVGGLAWAIEMSNQNIDVDLLYHDNLTIGHKISLTEKMVRVLQVMGCPHQLEPHQMSLEGMDCIKIFPVTQWLLKKSIEFRAKMADTITSYAVGQFNLRHRGWQHIQRQQVTQQPDASGSTPTSLSISVPNILTRIRSTQLDASSTRGRHDHREKTDDSEDEVGQTSSRLRTQLLSIQSTLMQVEQEEGTYVNSIRDLKEEIVNVREKQQELQTEKASSQSESDKEKRIQLVSSIDSLRKLKTQNKKLFKEQMASMEEDITKLEQEIDSFEEDEERNQLLRGKLAKDGAKMDQLNTTLADVSRRVMRLTRKIDDVPSRSEVNQYQRRLLELYDLTNIKLTEAKRFYVLYNQLDDERLHLNREYTLISSILETFTPAQQSATNRDQYLQQFKTIVTNLKDTHLKMNLKLMEQKSDRDKMMATLSTRLQQGRVYVKMGDRMRREMNRHQQLNHMLEAKKQQLVPSK